MQGLIKVPKILIKGIEKRGKNGVFGTLIMIKAGWCVSLFHKSHPTKNLSAQDYQ